MTFQPGTHTPPVNRHAISAKESDAIVAALRARPWAVAEIAADFNRSESTIDKIRAKNRLGLGGRAQ